MVVTDILRIIEQRGQRSFYPDQYWWKEDQCTRPVLLRQKFILVPSDHRPEDPGAADMLVLVMLITGQGTRRHRLTCRSS